MGKRVSAFPLMEAGVSESSSKGRYVSSTPFRTATYCLSELSILHQSRYSLLREKERSKEMIKECKKMAKKKKKAQTTVGERGEAGREEKVGVTIAISNGQRSNS